MKKRVLSVILFVISIAAVFLLTFFLAAKSQPATQAGNILELQAPAFVTQARAQENPDAFDIGAMLDQEAGISAYYKTSGAIALNQVRSLFRTIELETAEYIIGSIPIPNYPENFDVHTYVNVNGWILSYYIKTDPAAKIVDLKANTLTPTLPQYVVGLVAGAAGYSVSNVTYYDFRFPSATNMMLIYEDSDNGRDFTVQLPSSYIYYERTYSLSGNGSMYLDGAALAKLYNANYYAYGTISASQLLLDTDHKFEVCNLYDCVGVVALIYRIP
jgi:hypothetical protein